MSEKIVHVTDDNFENEVLQSSDPVLVDYWAEWCGPCKMIAPVLDEIASEYDGRVKVAKLNIDDLIVSDPGALQIHVFENLGAQVGIEWVAGYGQIEEKLKAAKGIGHVGPIADDLDAERPSRGVPPADLYWMLRVGRTHHT